MTTTGNTYALLIGVDNYRSSELYSNLQGCVQDINLVDACLQQTLQISPEQIFRLTAPLATSVLANARAKADPLPTYENIVKMFEKLTQTAQEDDLIYIHYSGHGGRVVTQDPEIKSDGQHDEGLVPTDYAQNGRYLRDVELATLLKRMTDKGIIVTLMLDSCHSGGATRGDCAIRGGLKVDEQPPVNEQLSDTKVKVASHQELVKNWRSLTSGQPLTGNLPASNDYVLLAACRPTEYAFEYSTNSEARHGALTYWLIDTLRALGPNVSYITLHDRISARIQSLFPSQLPMLVGAADRLFFSGDRQSTQYTATVLAIDAGNQLVTISAGMAQGVSEDARFAIYSAGSQPEQSSPTTIIEIVEVEATQATGRVLPIEEGGIATNLLAVEPGAPAERQTAPTDLLRRVSLVEPTTSGTADPQPNAMDTVRQAMAGNGWIVETDEAHRQSHYQVSVNASGHYEISTGTPIKNLTPSLSVHDSASAQKVVNRLVHLAKYQSVQALDNPTSPLRDMLTCELLTASKQPLPAQTSVTIKQNTRYYLRIRNNTAQTLNVALLDLEPNWAISQIYLRNIESPFYQMDKGETVDVPLRFMLPPGAHYQQATEILKVFATRTPADFRWLWLPSLDTALERKSSLGKRSNNPFSKLIETIGRDADEQSTLTRAAVYDSDPSDDWVTQQFSLTIQ